MAREVLRVPLPKTGQAVGREKPENETRMERPHALSYVGTSKQNETLGNCGLFQRITWCQVYVPEPRKERRGRY